jgi:anti-sigma regulatory factor (Ser/Thr protein kinase)
MTFCQTQLIIKSHPMNLQKIRKLISDATSKASLSNEDSAGIILAVDEACSNIIRHSYKNDYTKEIEINIALTSESMEICVIDMGKEFDINSIESRDIDEIKPGGFGIYIIQQVMDNVKFKRTTEGCNHMTMIKKIKT